MAAESLPWVAADEPLGSLPRHLPFVLQLLQAEATAEPAGPPGLGLTAVRRVTTHAVGSDCLNWHGRGPVPLSCSPQSATWPVMRLPPPRVDGDAPHRLRVRSFAPSLCSMLIRYLTVVHYSSAGQKWR